MDMLAVLFVAALINLAALIPLIAALNARANHDWTHEMRVFIALVPLTFFVFEFLMISTNTTTWIMKSFAILLMVVCIVMTIRFGYSAIVKPRFAPRTRRDASPTRVQPHGVSRRGSLSLLR